MGCFRHEHLPKDPDAAQARRDARAVLLVMRLRLRDGEPVDVRALSALAEDERLTWRLRTRAAEYAARAWIAAAEAVLGSR